MQDGETAGGALSPGLHYGRPGYGTVPPYHVPPAPGYVVLPAYNPLPRKPPLGARLRERMQVYREQAARHRLETALSVAASAAVVLGVTAMMLSSL